MQTPDPATGNTNPYDFPPEYHYPPFFTRQTNLTTYRSQCEKWSDLILDYCQHHRLYKLSLSNDLELFWNKRLNRRLSVADARDVLDFMRRDGRAEFVGGNGSGGGGGAEGGGDVVWVYWKTPEEWAQELETWVDETAQKNTVLTLYELTEGEDTRGAHPELLQKALQVLVKRGKAQIFGQEDQQGVKFF